MEIPEICTYNLTVGILVAVASVLQFLQAKTQKQIEFTSLKYL